MKLQQRQNGHCSQPVDLQAYVHYPTPSRAPQDKEGGEEKMKELAVRCEQVCMASSVSPLFTC